ILEDVRAARLFRGGCFGHHLGARRRLRPVQFVHREIRAVARRSRRPPLFDRESFRVYWHSYQARMSRVTRSKSVDGFLTGLGGSRGFWGTGGTHFVAPPEGEKRPLVRSEKTGDRKSVV